MLLFSLPSVSSSLTVRLASGLKTVSSSLPKLLTQDIPLEKLCLFNPVSVPASGKARTKVTYSV